MIPTEAGHFTGSSLRVSATTDVEERQHMATITEKRPITSTLPLTKLRRPGSPNAEDVRARLLALQRWESEGGAVQLVDEISPSGYSGRRQAGA